ncbi:MAG: hypothetical protein ACLQHA_08210 [Thermoplasmata archaeon]
MEVFPRSGVSELTTKLISILGKPASGQGNIGPSPLATTAWKVSDKRAFAELISKPKNFPPSSYSPHELDSALDAVSLGIWDSDALPYATLALNASIRPQYFANVKKEDLGAKLLLISHPLRLFIQSLGGLIAQSTSWSPNTPCVTWAGVAGSQQLLSDLARKTEVNQQSVLLWEDADPIYHSQIPRNPPTGFPFRFEYDYRIIQSRSFVPLAGNVGLLFGLSNQLGFSGRVTPYCICLATDASLFEHLPEILLDYRFATLPARYPDFLWGASALVSVVALNGWLRSVRLDIARIESQASQWRFTTSGQRDANTQPESDKILEIGMRTAQLASDLGVAARLFGDPLRIWESGSFESGMEIPSHRRGVLGGLAGETLDTLADQTARLADIRDEVSLLAEYASDRANTQTNQVMRDLTKEIATYSRHSAWLTAALVALTIVVAILTAILIVK